MNKNRSIFIILFLILMFVIDTQAQCPMCRIAAESNLENGGTAGKGLNRGILYMLSMPYLLVAGIGYIWYRNKKTDVDVLEDQITQQLSTSSVNK